MIKKLKLTKNQWILFISLIISILALLSSGVNWYLYYNQNQIAEQANVISISDYNCDEALNKLNLAGRYIEAQSSCNLSAVPSNQAMWDNASREYLYHNNCTGTISILNSINYTQCRKTEVKEFHVSEYSFFPLGITVTIIIVLAFLIFISVLWKKYSTKVKTRHKIAEKRPTKKGDERLDRKVGHYSFIGGVIIAILLGLFAGPLGTATVWLTSLLVVLGLVVGLLNVAGKETREFLLVAVVLIIATGVGGASDYLSGVQFIGAYLNGIFTQLLAFVVPATVIVSLKEIFSGTEKITKF